MRRTVFSYLEPLVKQGNADAQFNLGKMYEERKGVPQDYKTAVKWFKRAAAQGYAGAPRHS